MMANFAATIRRGCVVLLGATALAHAQQLPPRFPTAWRQQYFAHHEGVVFGATVGTVGGSFLVSYLAHASGADSSWEKKGAMSFTLPLAFIGTVAGAFGVSDESYVVAPIIGGVVGGFLGGALGRAVGRPAARGS